MNASGGRGQVLDTYTWMYICTLHMWIGDPGMRTEAPGSDVSSWREPMAGTERRSAGTLLFRTGSSWQ